MAGEGDSPPGRGTGILLAEPPGVDDQRESAMDPATELRTRLSLPPISQIGIVVRDMQEARVLPRRVRLGPLDGV